MNEALARTRRQTRVTPLLPDDQSDAVIPPLIDNGTPIERLMNNELKQILERAVDDLPEKYRLVYMMREIEGMSVAETSDCLAITQTNVKVRCNRAKEMLREAISGFYRDGELFQFNLVRCDRIVASVLGHIGARM
jgi:RNA polymerase sigma factor (sigma-70 family)